MPQNWLDKSIAFLSPERALKRARSRAAMDFLDKRVGARYEGASTGRRTANWASPSSSANQETQADLPLLRDRARDLVRNNPYGTKAIKVKSSTLIGSGYTPKIPVNIEGLPALWKKFCKQIDHDGMQNFNGLLTIAARSIFESGEAVFVKKYASSSKNLAVPFQLQLLEPDFIDERKNTSDTGLGGYQIQGVEFNESGQRIGYWMFKRHPGDGKRFDSSLIPAGSVRPLYEILRPGQVRGVPCFAPSIMRMRNIDEYDDAAILKKQTEACFAALITSEGGDISPITNLQSNSGSARAAKLEPGTLTGLKPGEDVKFAQPTSGNDYPEFMRSNLRAIAAGLGIPYELLTGDFSQVNYSSLRAGMISFREDIENLRLNMMIPFCEDIWMEFARLVNAMKLLGAGVSVPESVEWTTPPFCLVDPLKETLAMLLSVRAGFTSLPEAISQQGYDPTEQASEIAEFNTLLDSLGIVVDSDPRKINKAGGAQPDSPLLQSLSQD